MQVTIQELRSVVEWQELVLNHRAEGNNGAAATTTPAKATLDKFKLVRLIKNRLRESSLYPRVPEICRKLNEAGGMTLSVDHECYKFTFVPLAMHACGISGIDVVVVIITPLLCLFFFLYLLTSDHSLKMLFQVSGRNATNLWDLARSMAPQLDEEFFGCFCNTFQTGKSAKTVIR